MGHNRVGISGAGTSGVGVVALQEATGLADGDVEDGVVVVAAFHPGQLDFDFPYRALVS